MKKITLLAFILATFLTNAQVLVEDFSTGTGTTFPNGWTTSIAPGSSGDWVLGDTANTGVPAYGGDVGMISGGCDGFYALLDSDGLGGGFSQNASLVSPVMDLTGYSDLILKFNHHFRQFQTSTAYVEGTSNGGATWTELASYTADSEGLTSIDISTLAGNSAVQVRFRYLGAWEYYWGVDNIQVTQCTVAAPDLVIAATLPLDLATDVAIIYGEDDIINFEWPAPAVGSEVESYTFNLSTSLIGFPSIGSLGLDNNLVNLIYPWAPNTTYYWSVDTSNCAGSSTGTIFSFTTAACTATAAPIAVSTPVPADGATGVVLDNSDPNAANALAFTWVENESGLSYDLILSTDPLLTTSSTFTFENGEDIIGLSENTTYYWQIVANNCFGSTASPTWSFTTGTTASINDYDSKLFSIFPNPVIDILNIDCNASIDSIDIINQLGQSVLEVDINSMFNNQINLSKLNTGIYFVKVKSGSKTQTLQILKQ
jgi:hypothetical protein